MQFGPAFLKIAPGESVKFVPTDKGCMPHFGLGMVGIIQVGDNLDAAQTAKLPDKNPLGGADRSSCGGAAPAN